MIRILTFCLGFLFIFNSFAQPPGVRSGGGRPSQKISGEIFGNIIDSVTQAPMGYVTVLAVKHPDSSMAGGVISSDNGNFAITDLKPGIYDIKFTFIGYETKVIPNIKITPQHRTHQIKDLAFSPKVLDAVEVVGDKPIVTYEIDKKVINVEDQITTTGQTAVEVLENAPSVTVDADGNVSLRGSSSFTLLIDGIPTAMDANDALATIPASTIKDIEIITNPSAKFDAEGTSGVINIITKKNKLEGVSCLANLTGGTFNNYSGDLALNIKKNAFTFNLAGNFSQRSRPRDVYTERTSVYDSVTNVLISEGQSDWFNKAYGFSGEIQWAPNNSHVVAVKSRYSNRLMIPYSDMMFRSYDDGTLVSSFATDQHNYIDLNNLNTSLFYQYNIKRNQAHHITFKAIMNMVDVRQDDTTTSYDESGNILSSNLYTETGPSNFTRFNLDYVLPLKQDRKFETGLQSQFGLSGDDGKNYVYNLITNNYDFNEQFSSQVDYTRDVHAAYTMFSGKQKKLGYQLGLRAEYTYRTIQSTSAIEFTDINRLDWFPSAHFSYNLANKDQILVSYSRRIQRPRSYYFEPFITWESPFQVRTGNPNLIPEYINVFEMSYVKPIKRKGFLSLELYFRQENNIIRRISTVYDEGILISQPYNIGTSNSFGIEPSLNYNLTKWWKLNAGANIYLFQLAGNIESVSYDTESYNWNGRLMQTFSYKSWTLQLNSRYTSASVSAQGEDRGYFNQSVSLRKGFDNNKYSLTLQGRNILNTQKRISTSITENVTIYSERMPLFPQLLLTFSMKLNNYQKVYDRHEAADDF